MEGVIIIYIAILVMVIASMWTIYTKAGKPGWASLVPIYNIIVLLEMVGKPWWWLFLMFVPIVNIVIMVMIYHNLSLSFGKSSGFTAGIIFLGIIFIPMLAFGEAKYIGPGGNVSEN